MGVNEISDTIDDIRRKRNNLKSIIKRRIKKMMKTSDLSERVKIEREVEELRWKLWELYESDLKITLPVLDAMANLFDYKRAEGEPDWSKAGRA